MLKKSEVLTFTNWRELGEALYKACSILADNAEPAGSLYVTRDKSIVHIEATFDLLGGKAESVRPPV
jgi:hypothetical protein